MFLRLKKSVSHGNLTICLQDIELDGKDIKLLSYIGKKSHQLDVQIDTH